MSLLDLTEVRGFLGISSAAGDLVALATLVDGAEDWVERFCGIKLASTELVHHASGGLCTLSLPYGPLLGVTEIVDVFDDDEVVDPDEYAVRSDWVYRVSSSGALYNWPRGEYRFKVSYTAGYTTVPASVKAALLNLVHRAYFNRGDVKSRADQGLTVSWDNIASGDIREALAATKRGGFF
ncbi:MAG: hypothetical protein ACOCVH_02045 [Verrucomicrobiota bacterium]